MEAQDWALLVLRAGAGLILVTHGFWHMKAAGHSGTRRLKTEGYRHANPSVVFPRDHLDRRRHPPHSRFGHQSRRRGPHRDHG